MANGDIRQKIVLEGEREYSAALKEAQRNLKVLRSELKAETAELGKNATEQQKNEARTKNLQKQIKEQEKIVRTYEKALEEVRKKYGDNEEAVAKWEIKLNDARTALANLQNSVDTTSTSIANMGKTAQDSGALGVVAMNSFADSLGKIASVGNSVSSSIEGAFTGVVGFISDAVSELWNQIMDVAARAGDWNDIATMWGSSAGNIQKWYHAARAEGKDFARLSSYVTKIVTGDQKKIAQSSLVSAEAYEDQWDYAMAVMDSLSRMDAKGQMEALAGMGISGAKQEGWLDMLKAWGDIQKKTAKFNAEEGGIGLTDEEIGKADRLAKAVSMLQESWTALKDHALINLFGDIALNVTGNVQNILDAFHEYFSAENDTQRQQALDKIQENIEDAFETIRAALEEGFKALGRLANQLQTSEDPAVRAFGKLLEKIVSVLSWFADESNWDTVKRGFEALIGVWAAGKVVKAIGNITAFATNVQTIIKAGKKLFDWGGGKGDNPGTEPNTEPGDKPTTQPTTPPATQPVSPTPVINPTVGAIGPSFSSSLLSWGSASGIGTGLGGGASLTLIGAAGGTALILGGAYGISALVNKVNEAANAAREVEADYSRYTGFEKKTTKAGRSYEFGGIDTQGVLESYVNSLFKTSGGTKGINSPQNILKRMAGGLGGDILSAFEYTNKSGETRNKLIDMLGMDDQNAAVAAMMLRYAGVSTSKVDYSAQLAKYDELKRSGGLGYENALLTLRDFFRNSGSFDDSNRWYIPGYENTSGIMPVINGQPLANMSGYAMTSNKPKYLGVRITEGTWDPSSRVIYSDSWGGEGGRQPAEITEASVSRIAGSVKSAISGVIVYMDGEKVGHLVAPTVSQDIAREAVQ